MTTQSNDQTSYVLPFLAILLISGMAIYFASSHKNTPMQPSTLINWKQVSSFNYPRRALAAVATQNHLYVIGGISESGEYVRQVEYTKIQPDGSLGEWHETTSLNQGRFYLAAVALDGSIYALGGGAGELGDNNIPVATVEAAKILPDGSLSPWIKMNDMTTPRRGLKAVQYNNRIYAIGGYNGAFLRSVETAAVSPDGLLSPWHTDSHESKLVRYIHSASIYKNNIYLLGGHVQRSDKMSYGDVEMTSINNDGTLQPWVVEKTSLLNPRFMASSFALNQMLYILGGHNGGNRLNSVEFASIGQNGHVGRWGLTAPLNDPRSAATVTKYNDHVYVLGGMGMNQVLNSVEMAVFQN